MERLISILIAILALCTVGALWLAFLMWIGA